MKNGHRLAFLVVEVEPGQALSTRKLLLEGAKHNVLTAHSPEEGLRMFQRFPQVDVVAIDGSFGDSVCSKLAEEVRRENKNVPIVGFIPKVGARCSWADKTTNSHDPAGLLKLLEKMGGRTKI
jgi:CheY-like chemotaxis protein